MSFYTDSRKITEAYRRIYGGTPKSVNEEVDIGWELEGRRHDAAIRSRKREERGNDMIVLNGQSMKREDAIWRLRSLVDKAEDEGYEIYPIQDALENAKQIEKGGEVKVPELRKTGDGKFSETIILNGRPMKRIDAIYKLRNDIDDLSQDYDVSPLLPLKDAIETAMDGEEIDYPEIHRQKDRPWRLSESAKGDASENSDYDDEIDSAFKKGVHNCVEEIDNGIKKMLQYGTTASFDSQSKEFKEAFETVTSLGPYVDALLKLSSTPGA